MLPARLDIELILIFKMALGMTFKTWDFMSLKGTLRVFFRGDLEVNLDGDSKGDFRGTLNGTWIWKGTCCHTQVR